MHITMKKVLFVLVQFASIPFYANAQSAVSANVKEQKSPLVKANQQVSYLIVNSPENTWGYEILIDNVPYIRQLSVPGMQGNQGFDKKEQAVETAKLVVQKVKNDVMPPAVTQEELTRIMDTK
ncbi:MAG: DUF4907 domain-containing protein [Sphingobacteriales bacterium]|nr:MAG: DUF4907 domain-containing protein [Sphingobacteriales bacterium]